MAVSKCPRCDEEVSLPVGASAAAEVECPLCQEAFQLSEILDRLPPTLKVLHDPEAFTEDQIEDADDEDFVAGFAESSENEGDDFQLAPASDSDRGGFDFSGGGGGGGTATAIAPSTSSVKSTPARKKKKKSPVAEMGWAVPASVRGVAPAEAASGMSRNDTNASNGPNTTNVASSEVPPVNGGSSFDLGEAFNNSAAGQNGNSNNGNSNNGDTTTTANTASSTNPADPFGPPGSEDPFAVPASSENGTDTPAVEPPSDPLAIGEISIDNPLAIDVPSPIEPTETPEEPEDPLAEPVQENVGFKEAGESAAADVDDAAALASDALAAWDAGEKSVRDGADLYKAMTEFAITASRAKPASDSVVKDVLTRLVASEKSLEMVDKFASYWISRDDKNKGIVLAGFVDDVVEGDGMFVSKISAGESVITVVSKFNPGELFAGGQKGLILGAIVDDPAAQIDGYTGPDQRVVWGSHGVTAE